MTQEERLPPGFVDIHCHLLPGLDDGPANWDQALAMARTALENGFAWIVATPHQRGRHSKNTPDVIRRVAEEARRRLEDRQISLELFPGADVRIDDTLIDDLQLGMVQTIADGRYMLLELPHDVYFPLDRLLREMRNLGVTGILTHPERNHAIIRRPELLEELIRGGALVQITAGSITGAFGPAVRRFSEGLLLAGKVHVVATDAHGTHVRPPSLSDAHRQIARLVGRDAADILCRRNPARIVLGLSPQRLEPVRSVQSFWSRTWRRLAG
ncbi:MAG: tyrosine-protein phosphatase [Thermogutta sp.]